MRIAAVIFSSIFALLASGCANDSGARMGLFSASAPVIAILEDDLFLGEAIGYADGSGTINIKSALNEELKCVGSFHYTGSRVGVAELHCNDGAEAKMSFNSLSALSGYGFGRTTRGPASFTYGLTPEEATQYLKLPKGKRVVKKSEGVRLESI